MSDQYKWIDTDGGPFLLLSQNALPFWRGTQGWSFQTHGEDISDYSRACAVTDWVGKIRCGEDDVYVLGGDVGRLSWIATKEFEGGFLVQWLGVDDETQILPAIQSKGFEELMSSQSAEHTRLEIGAPGHPMIIQASDIGRDLVGPSLSIELRSGAYCATSVYLETPSLAIVVRKLELIL